MHKEIIICAIIIIFIIVLNIIAMNYTQDAVETVSSDLNRFKSNIMDENPNNDEIRKNNKEIMNKWREKYNVLAYFIEHDELEKVETELTALEASIDVEKYEDGVENLERCIFILNHIKDKYSLNIKNIF